MRVVGATPVPYTAAELRARALAFAEADIGVIGGGAYFDLAAPCYATPAERKGKNWCQIAVLAWLRLAEITSRRWVDRVGVFGALPTTRYPELADVAILPYARFATASSKPIWHGALVKRLDGDTLVSIDANTSGGKTREVVRDLRDYQQASIWPYFCSIDPWLREALALAPTDLAPLPLPTVPPSAPAEPLLARTLHRGTKGEDVGNWQRALLAWDPKALPVYGADDDFGSETERWTALFLLAHDLLPVKVDEHARKAAGL